MTNNTINRLNTINTLFFILHKQQRKPNTSQSNGTRHTFFSFNMISTSWNEKACFLVSATNQQPEHINTLINNSTTSLNTCNWGKHWNQLPTDNPWEFILHIDIKDNVIIYYTDISFHNHHIRQIGKITSNHSVWKKIQFHLFAIFFRTKIWKDVCLNTVQIPNELKGYSLQLVLPESLLLMNPL